MAMEACHSAAPGDGRDAVARRGRKKPKTHLNAAGAVGPEPFQRAGAAGSWLLARAAFVLVCVQQLVLGVEGDWTTVYHDTFTAEEIAVPRGAIVRTATPTRIHPCGSACVQDRITVSADGGRAVVACAGCSPGGPGVRRGRSSRRSVPGGISVSP